MVITRWNSTGHAGAKAPDDVRTVCLRMGFTATDLSPLPERRYTLSNLRRLAGDATRLVASVASLEPTDISLVQHPLRGRLESEVLRLLCARTRSICLVHDLDWLRLPSQERERDLIKRFDTIIVHNDRMREVVRDMAPSADLVVLGIFDYLTSDGFFEPRHAVRPRRLYVIGNLHPLKAGYLYGLPRLATDLVAYGPNCTQNDLGPGARWAGVLDMQNPAFGQVDGFGLVWDGDSAQHLNGVWGDYLRVNTPHKLSLYILLGMPVIIPSDAAMADFVRSEGIGLCVTNLAEAAEVAACCSEADWAELYSNVLNLRKRLRSGYYTQKAIGAALSSLSA